MVKLYRFYYLRFYLIFNYLSNEQANPVICNNERPSIITGKSVCFRTGRLFQGAKRRTTKATQENT